MSNPKGFNTAVLKIIAALGGDPRTGRCLCPVHDDGANPSLEIANGDRVLVVLHCHGKNDRAHDLEIIEHLRNKGVWPGSSHLEGYEASAAAEEARKPDERRQRALKIWNQLNRANGGREMSDLLLPYLTARGLKTVPNTAVLALPFQCRPVDSDPNNYLHTQNPGMILPIRDKTGNLQGIQATWLDYTLTTKREEEPRRQTYGNLKGNFLELVELDYNNLPEKFIIGEGAETGLAAMQLTGLPAIATGGKVAHVDPPPCREYIILVDADDSGGSRSAAGVLAQRLVGSVVRIAAPIRLQGGKSGYDWNDALVDAGDDEVKLAELRRWRQQRREQRSGKKIQRRKQCYGGQET
jgi:hypothetical protein